MHGWRTYIIISTVLGSVAITSCTRESEQQAHGYIEGRYTYMSTSVSGALINLAVKRGTHVRKGDLLFELQQRPESDAYQSALENVTQSMASRDSTEANLTYAKLQYERDKILVPKKALQQSELDNARSVFLSTTAQLAQASANIASTGA